MEPSTTLNWRQGFLAYWSIVWPGWILGVLVLFIGLGGPREDEMELRLIFLAPAFQIIFHSCQVLLLPRLLTKRFHTFRIALTRDDGDQKSKLQPIEVAWIALKLLVPQLAFLFVATAGLAAADSTLDERTILGVSALSKWLQLLAVGPLAVRYAIGANYPGFRLVVHPAPGAENAV
jgi:hypothetical protein